MAFGGMKLPKMNPNEYAKLYAQNNGMNIAGAKTALQGQFGNPQAGGLNSQSIFSFEKDQAPNLMINDDMTMAQMGQANGSVPNIFSNIMNFFNGNKDNNEKWGELEFNVGGPKKNDGANGQLPPKDMDPDAYAQQYAKENGISVEEAKAQLKAKFGDPHKH